ncbi:MAG: serine O-acetyltransferase [Planctomycetota bacterium]|jgi:serine O-acetyltransferase
MALFKNVRVDLRRARIENLAGRRGAWLAQFFHPGTIAVLVYRFGHWAWLLPVPGLRHLLLALYYPFKIAVQVSLQVNIPTRAEIGPGLVIHTWGGVFLPPCRIGRNAFFQFGNVVRYDCDEVGDDVYFGPGAKVIRPVRIGHRAQIGANAVVLHDVPDDCTVAGVPARIVRKGPKYPAKVRQPT